MKICSKCEIEKELVFFSKSSVSKNGYKSQCKSCIAEKERERRKSIDFIKRNKEYINSIPDDVKKKRRKKYYLKHKDDILEKNKRYRQENKEYFKKYNYKYQQENKDKILLNGKKWREENPERNKKWREENPDKVKEYRDRYSRSEKCKEHRKKWYKSIKKRKPYILAWRSLLNNTLKRINRKKEDETIKLLGYSAIELKEHLESLFLDEMSWDNYGEWHIDHIKMVSEFEEDTPVNIVNSLDNLRPLWASDNCSRKLN
jgi:hypothetical protein